VGNFLGLILGIWFWVGILSSPYFWFKRTDRSQAPITRRFTAMAYGLAWPYFVYSYFAGRAAAQAAQASQAEAEARILGKGDVPSRPSSSVNEPKPDIRNPFDN
jgi:hypothetical protein